MNIAKLYKYSKEHRKGQSAIEFIVVVVVLMFFLLFFMSLSVLFVVSDYVEYATFMAARTYKSMFSSKEKQQENARIVFDSYVNRVQGIARDFNLEFVEGDERGEQGAGVQSTYSIDLFYLPPVFIPGAIPPSKITLKSETRLGRDPAYNECFSFFDSFARRFGLGLEGTGYVRQMDDNGC